MNLEREFIVMNVRTGDANGLTLGQSDQHEDDEDLHWEIRCHSQAVGLRATESASFILTAPLFDYIHQNTTN